MAENPRYLSLTNAIELHAQAMESTGFQKAPLRDENVLGSALMRPQMAVHYEGADLIRQAALLIVGISQAQAFLDGNKRTAYACCDVFLRINGMQFQGDPADLAKQLEAVAARENSLDEATDQFEAWLRQRVMPTEAG